MKITEDQKVCPIDGNTNKIGVEYWYGSKHRYDGISEWMWQPCGHRFGRWTGEPIMQGFAEPRYGEGGKPVPVGDDDDNLQRLGFSNRIEQSDSDDINRRIHRHQRMLHDILQNKITKDARMSYQCPICKNIDKGHEVLYCYRCQPEQYKKDKG